MRLTTRARYAVAAMVDLAALDCCEPTKLAGISQRQDISLAYLEQLFCRLRRAGLVRSVRGPGGGYCLSLVAAEISIGQIIRAVDEVNDVARCAEQTDCACAEEAAGQSQKYGTNDLWDALSRQINMYLDNVSLAHIISGMIPEPLVGEALLSEPASGNFSTSHKPMSGPPS